MSTADSFQGEISKMSGRRRPSGHMSVKILRTRLCPENSSSEDFAFVFAKLGDTGQSTISPFRAYSSVG